MGALRLSDGGGPFGFDITAAIQVDFVISAYGCDALVETGCFLGDTTSYLAKAYPDLPLVACDVVAEYAEFTRHRIAAQPQAEIHHADSPDVVAAASRRFERPFFYLDAHWYEPWPLLEELQRVRRGVVCIDDFDIGDPRFGFDVYDGLVCGPGLMARLGARGRRYFVGNPRAEYPFPCLQVGRRSGRCFLPVGLPFTPLEESDFFVAARADAE